MDVHDGLLKRDNGVKTIGGTRHLKTRDWMFASFAYELDSDPQILEKVVCAKRGRSGICVPSLASMGVTSRPSTTCWLLWTPSTR